MYEYDMSRNRQIYTMYMSDIWSANALASHFGMTYREVIDIVKNEFVKEREESRIGEIIEISERLNTNDSSMYRAAMKKVIKFAREEKSKGVRERFNKTNGSIWYYTPEVTADEVAFFIKKNEQDLSSWHGIGKGSAKFLLDVAEEYINNFTDQSR